MCLVCFIWILQSPSVGIPSFVVITLSINKRQELSWSFWMIRLSIPYMVVYTLMWAHWDILLTLVVVLLPAISSMTSSVSVTVSCTGCSVIGFRNLPCKLSCILRQLLPHSHNRCLKKKDVHILFVSTIVHFENESSCSCASSESVLNCLLSSVTKCVPNCWLTVSYSHLEILTLPTSCGHYILQY